MFDANDYQALDDLRMAIEELSSNLRSDIEVAVQVGDTIYTKCLTFPETPMVGDSIQLFEEDPPANRKSEVIQLGVYSRTWREPRIRLACRLENDNSETIEEKRERVKRLDFT